MRNLLVNKNNISSLSEENPERLADYLDRHLKLFLNDILLKHPYPSKIPECNTTTISTNLPTTPTQSISLNYFNKPSIPSTPILQNPSKLLKKPLRNNYKKASNIVASNNNSNFLHNQILTNLNSSTKTAAFPQPNLLQNFSHKPQMFSQIFDSSFDLTPEKFWLNAKSPTTTIIQAPASCNSPNWFLNSFQHTGLQNQNALIGAFPINERLYTSTMSKNFNSFTPQKRLIHLKNNKKTSLEEDVALIDVESLEENQQKEVKHESDKNRRKKISEKIQVSINDSGVGESPILSNLKNSGSKKTRLLWRPY